MDTCEKYKPLLMGLIDNELTPEEISELNQHMIRCSRCRDEYEELRDTCSKIGHVSFYEASDKELDKIWKTPYSRFSRSSALLLIFGGWAVLSGYGIYMFIRSGILLSLPGLCTASMIIGFFILLISFIQERMKTYKYDPYKEVKR